MDILSQCLVAHCRAVRFLRRWRAMDMCSTADSRVIEKKRRFRVHIKIGNGRPFPIFIWTLSLFIWIFLGTTFRAVTVFGAASEMQDLPEWENPHLTGLSNQPPHATMIICPDMA